jgi:uncharacterized integral membrane protein
MKFLNFILLIVLVALLVFAAVNWQAIVTPVPLSLLFTDAEAPLGLILLTITGILTLLFLSYVVYMQSATIMLRRKLNKELEEQRKLADQAEASRFTELRAFLTTELQKLNTQSSEVHQKVEARLAEVENSVKSKMEETGTTLSAYIGELEDRLEKK